MSGSLSSARLLAVVASPNFGGDAFRAPSPSLMAAPLQQLPIDPVHAPQLLVSSKQEYPVSAGLCCSGCCGGLGGHLLSCGCQRIMHIYVIFEVENTIMSKRVHGESTTFTLTLTLILKNLLALSNNGRSTFSYIVYKSFLCIVLMYKRIITIQFKKRTIIVASLWTTYPPFGS